MTDILAKLPEHLQIITNTRSNPELVVVASLLATETDVISNFAHFAQDERVRIAWWISCLNESKTHDGDCVKSCSTCILCLCLSQIKDAEQFILNAKPFSSKQVIHMILCTQPQQKFPSLSELYKHIGSFEKEKQFDEIGKAIHYETDLKKRMEIYEKNKLNFTSKVDELVAHAEKCLSIDPSVSTQESEDD